MKILSSKKFRIVLLVVLLTLGLCAFAACNNASGGAADAVIVRIDGDVQGGSVDVNLANIQKSNYSYSDDGVSVNSEGWNFNSFLSAVTLPYQNNKLMISATDGTSVLLQLPLTSEIYLYVNENGKLCSKGPGYPRSTGLRDVAELTVVTTDTATDGYKVLDASQTLFVSRGNAKLALFDLVAENTLNGNSADKYLPAVDKSVSGFTKATKNIVYTKDYDIIKDATFLDLAWADGKLNVVQNTALRPVHGFVTGTDDTIMDAYDDMKAAIDANKKVMYILVDGFSWQQANVFADDLDALKLNASVKTAASTHLSISPVALAATVTGQSPYINGVHFDEDESRAVLKPKVDDIFKYATDKNKSVAYLEGNGNLIIASVDPVYAIGDDMIYANAQTAVSSGKELIFVHFHEVDDTNHNKGPLSDEAKTQLMYTDSWIKNLIASFDGTVIVSADHGHNTLRDSDGKAYGKHGMFTNLDMYVPYYVFEG